MILYREVDIEEEISYEREDILNRQHYSAIEIEK